MCLRFCFILKYHGVVILNWAFGKKSEILNPNTDAGVHVCWKWFDCNLSSFITKWNEKLTF